MANQCVGYLDSNVMGSEETRIGKGEDLIFLNLFEHFKELVS